MNHKRARRRLGGWLALAATGGVLLQAGGCATALLPIVLSILESLVLETVLNSLIPVP